MKHKSEITKDFKFKKFAIYGGLSGMPVSTDGVLLGAWIDVDQNKSILDIGTGTGLLSLMCAQRCSQAKITAVEINTAAYDAAKTNFEHSSWKERLNLIRADILSWEANNTFDTIVCNPPYFNSGEQSKRVNRATARHTDSLPHSDLLAASKQRLKKNGRANYILPYIEGMKFIEIAKKLGWSVSRLCQVAPTEAKPINRLLIELSLENSETEQTHLTINVAGQYSSEFIALTKDFYLKM